MIHYFNFTESNLVEANVVKKTDLEEINADKSKKIFQENFACILFNRVEYKLIP